MMGFQTSGGTAFPRTAAAAAASGLAELGPIESLHFLVGLIDQPACCPKLVVGVFLQADSGKKAAPSLWLIQRLPSQLLPQIGQARA